MAELILVSGAPASGKTTLAERLAADCGVRILAKDTIKEALAAEHPVSTGRDPLDHSRHLGRLAVRTLYERALLGRHAGETMILDSAFHRGLSEVDLKPLLEMSRTVLVHCGAASDVAAARYDRRAPGRHAIHADQDRHIDATAPRWQPMELDVPRLLVDTTDGYRPGYRRIRAFVSQPQVK